MQPVFHGSTRRPIPCLRMAMPRPGKHSWISGGNIRTMQSSPFTASALKRAKSRLRSSSRTNNQAGEATTMPNTEHVDLNGFMEGVKRRNPGQPEFVQAVQEVARDVF